MMRGVLALAVLWACTMTALAILEMGPPMARDGRKCLDMSGQVGTQAPRVADVSEITVEVLGVEPIGARCPMCGKVNSGLDLEAIEDACKESGQFHFDRVPR